MNLTIRDNQHKSENTRPNSPFVCFGGFCKKKGGQVLFFGEAWTTKHVSYKQREDRSCSVPFTICPVAMMKMKIQRSTNTSFSLSLSVCLSLPPKKWRKVKGKKTQKNEKRRWEFTPTTLLPPTLPLSEPGREWPCVLSLIGFSPGSVVG